MTEAASEHRTTLQRHAFHGLRVSGIVAETADTRTFVFDVPAQLTDTYRYAAGQFCTVRATIAGSEVARCYSMSSAPALEEPLAFTVKRVPGGTMSNWLIDHAKVGDTLEVSPPAGRFCEQPGESPILAFCGGSGVTPVFSIVKQALRTGRRRIRVLCANRDREAIIFRTAFDELIAEHGERLTVDHHLDVDSGYLAAEDIADFVGNDTDADVFVCGPTPFMDIVQSAVEAAGVRVAQVAIERFTDDPGATTGDEPVTDEGTSTTERLTVTLKRKRREVDYVDGDTVLEAARRAGLAPPFSCEQGNCATCMALVTDGEVAMRVNNALTPEEVEEGWVLTCQALPVSTEVAIEYDDL